MGHTQKGHMLLTAFAVSFRAVIFQRESWQCFGEACGFRFTGSNYNHFHSFSLPKWAGAHLAKIQTCSIKTFLQIVSQRTCLNPTKQIEV